MDPHVDKTSNSATPSCATVLLKFEPFPETGEKRRAGLIPRGIASLRPMIDDFVFDYYELCRIFRKKKRKKYLIQKDYQKSVC